jgi:hypothetical protein
LNGPTEPVQKATTEVDKAKKDVIEATIELRHLLEGPMKLLLPEVSSPSLLRVLPIFSSSIFDFRKFL